MDMKLKIKQKDGSTTRFDVMQVKQMGNTQMPLKSFLIKKSMRMILWEFNIDQLIRIVQKSIIKLQAMFGSGLVIPRSNSAFKGYQQ